MEEEADWEQLKKDLCDPTYAEIFLKTAMAIIIDKELHGKQE